MELFFGLLLASISLFVLYAHFVFNPFIGFNGEEGEGLWAFLVVVTIVVAPFLVLVPFVGVIWLGWLGAGTPDGVARANEARGRRAKHSPSPEYLRVMENLEARRNARLNQVPSR